jgi:hypothetical protein
MKKTNKYQEFTKIGNGDFKYNYITKWPIYKLDVLNKKGLWNTLQTICESIKNDDKFDMLTEHQIEKFFFKRPEIDFEINFFLNTMDKCFVFKFKNKIYCYTFGEIKRKNGRKIFVRFYFDYNRLFSEL